MPAKWYNNVIVATVLTEDLEPTMSTPGDEMEITGGKERKKLIHTVGCVSKF